MAVFNKFQNFVQDLGRGVHNLDTGVLKVMLTNAAPVSATNTVKADLTEIAAGNGYSAGGATIAGTDYTQTAGTGNLTGTDPVITAAGGSIGPFRYAVLYNDTPTSPADPLIGYWDYGSSISLADTEALTVDLATNFLTVA
jgi:hypothetical protein